LTQFYDFMPQSPNTAKEIAEDILERTRIGLIENEFETFVACFALPHSVDTIEGRKLIETHEQVRVTFDSIQAFFAEHGVTDISRQCIDASFRNDDTITTVHKTRLLKGLITTRR